AGRLAHPGGVLGRALDRLQLEVAAGGVRIRLADLVGEDRESAGGEHPHHHGGARARQAGDDVDRRSHGVAGYPAPGPGPTPPPVIPWRVEHDEQGRHLAMTQPARRESMVGEINTLLGRGSEFEGKLTFEGTVRIDGTLRGEV